MSVGIDNVAALVVTASVYDDVFDKVAARLIDNALYGTLQPLSIIVVNGDDGNFHNA